jgi:hypothetical protein
MAVGQRRFPNRFGHISEILEAFADLEGMGSRYVLLREFDGDRNKYVVEAIKFARACRSPKVILLDPDTGMAPDSGGGRAHVRGTEIEQFWAGALTPGDWLAVYQHRPRGMADASWKHMKKQRLYQLATLVGSSSRGWKTLLRCAAGRK